MKTLATTAILGLALALGMSAHAQEEATGTFDFTKYGFVEEATTTTDASGEFGAFTNVPEGLLLANQGFMALRNHQFDAAIGFYTQAAQRDAKFTDMLEYTKTLRDQFAVFPSGPMDVSEMRLPAQWGDDHPMEIWARVKVKFWLGWFKSVLPRDQAVGAPQGPQYMYNIPQDPTQMGVPQGGSGAVGGGAAPFNPLAPQEILNQTGL